MPIDLELCIVFLYVRYRDAYKGMWHLVGGWYIANDLRTSSWRVYAGNAPQYGHSSMTWGSTAEIDVLLVCIDVLEFSLEGRRAGLADTPAPLRHTCVYAGPAGGLVYQHYGTRQ